MLGGPGWVVHIDETMINHKIKAHRSRNLHRQVWLIAIVDTNFVPSLRFCCIVENRTAAHMLPIIPSVVRSGSVIDTDKFKSYLGLSSMNDYEHRSICHKYHFMDSITRVHTQNVESFNNKIKRKIKRIMGLDETGRRSFIKEFLFLNLFKDSSYQQIVNILKINFNLYFLPGRIMCKVRNF